MYIIPKVTIRAGILNQTIKTPLINPVMAPTLVPIRILNQAGTPFVTVMDAIIPPNANTGATDRSRPAEIRTYVIAMPIMKMKDVLRKIFARFSPLKNIGFTIPIISDKAMM